jgi:hypothetical protein
MYWYPLVLVKHKTYFYNIESNLSYVTFQGDIEIRSHKTCGHSEIV